MKLLAAAACLYACMTCANAGVEQWNFNVYLDGKPIGTHRYEVDIQGNERRVQSTAHFLVTLLGIPIYRYRHDAIEHWRGDCLQDLMSTTDEDGKHLSVNIGSNDLASCKLSYAYWNPAIFEQTQLLNAQTGTFDSVKITSLGLRQVDVQGMSLEANGWRIDRSDGPIDVWYAQGRWVGLDSVVSGGRKLSYRLQ